MLLVRSNLDVVRSDGGLVLIGVVKALDIVQVADVEGGDVVGRGEGQVEEAAILADVGAGERGRLVAALAYWVRCNILNGNSITGLGAKVIELFDDTLLAVCVLAKGVDDPDLTEVDGSS